MTSSRIDSALRIMKSRKVAPGITEVGKGLYLEILEGRSVKDHKHIVGSFPAQPFVETSFTTGPVFTILANDSIIDVENGVVLVGGKVILESFVTARLVDRYKFPSDNALNAAKILGENRIVVPLATQRTLNYCRWWLDSISKIYLASTSSLVRQNLRSKSLDVVAPPPANNFQKQSMDLFNWRAILSTMNRGSLLRGQAVTSSGLAVHGGQRIGAMVRDFALYMDTIVPAFPVRGVSQGGALIYLSRNESSMRRILNEDEIIPGLMDLGFKIVKPVELSVWEQIEIFRNAKVILGAHGAGLTNIIFCRPGTKVIEIFPEGGVHGSAFVRLSSHLAFPYYFATGEAVQKDGSEDPRNADIVLSAAEFLAFVKEAIA